MSCQEYLQYQRQRWETEQLLVASNQPLPAFFPSPRVLDQEIIPSPAPHLSFPGVPLLQQLSQPSSTMSTATGELPLFPSSLSYDYSKLGFAYLTMLGLTEQVIPHMKVWRPWAMAANYVMWMAPVIYWAFQARPFPLTEGSPGSPPGHDSFLLLIWSTSPDLWGQFSSSVLRVSNNTSHLLYLMEDLLGRAQDLLISGENLVKSLTYDYLDLLLLDLLPGLLHEEDSPSSALSVKDSQPIYWPIPGPQVQSTQCTPGFLQGWLLWGSTSTFFNCPPRPLLGLLFEQPYQCCTGWYPGESFPWDGS
ncbi:hypothetical protein DSO57_1039041 [Entomophthora muscae]|uniref:Uncharacterized protein n=1 Tax=Entomophthora muscae TaxID=34485 RepID=A0ACC2RD91_9FUNG|nr:hypothetical protein DSO57_1039041 [Entomophthora muscae]